MATLFVKIEILPMGVTDHQKFPPQGDIKKAPRVGGACGRRPVEGLFLEEDVVLVAFGKDVGEQVKDVFVFKHVEEARWHH